MQKSVVRRAFDPRVISSAAVGGAALSFSFGLLIVNLRLARYGVFSSEFVRTEYILAGAMFLSLVAISYFFFVSGIDTWNRIRQRWRDRRWLKVALGGLIIPVEILTIPLWVLISASNYQVRWDHMILGLFGLIVLGSLSRRLFESSFGFWKRLAKEPADTLPKYRFEDVRTNLILVPAFLMLVALYAQLIYPQLSPAIGGGRHDPVLLFVNDRGLTVSKSLNLPLQTDGVSVGPLDVLSESDSEIVVLAPTDESASVKRWAIRLHRNLFDAVATVAIKK